MTSLAVGDTAPDFDLPIDGGDRLRLDDLKGQNVVLYFYPKDDTPGCTKDEAYGVWVEKAMYGKTYMGIERATYLIDAAGKIAQVWRKVRVPGHVDAVLEAARGI